MTSAVIISVRREGEDSPIHEERIEWRDLPERPMRMEKAGTEDSRHGKGTGHANGWTFDGTVPDWIERLVQAAGRGLRG